MITTKAIEFEKVSLDDIENLKNFVDTLTADDKYSLFNRDNLRQPIQMQLSQKDKAFSELFAAFW